MWNIDLVLKPTLLSAVVSKAGNSPPGMVPNKMAYMVQDLRIGAKYFNVPWNPIKDVQSVFFEKGTMKPMRFLTAVAQKSPDKLEEMSRQLWMRIWSRVSRNFNNRLFFITEANNVHVIKHLK